ncbi:hypothetical protein FNV43_RR08119 [Rhamnella rubrinervis]|uniref:MORF/ORRM1/DAG-like MORF domain-containing protein n=1 Tax=Rhamnella rubrinervis TaxID=2594499 RepID=A0A8K0HHZ5_9ROSA|nr:hypothetical protein FNV43_RR08119 [Rhamnella rubrinervis]
MTRHLCLLRKQSNLTAGLCCRYLLLNTPSFNFPPLPSFPASTSRCFSGHSGPKDSPVTQCSELTRVTKLVQGCDYKHWLVLMEPPKGYPLRHEIVNGYIRTLAVALGSSEEEAKRSIYSVSTKYYYAFGCKIPEDMTYKIKYLPNVRWVLPDSYLCHGENDYGGEPMIDCVVVPYDEKYHQDWVMDQSYDKCRSRTCISETKEKQKKI